ncbi:hypothetical protein F4553_006121 [Allocatelliglobosispora scoriae]|uniref:Pyrrolo-quinoline quinone repeat domain-containing protein n=1 Tax=Allocatelliglobosispora scoriae TaxID=643052 RepID=A0A841BUA6_9ACTN|nr:PQQ-binding-like beta-propeller repeat protein [Allocatelliglobosispora scoriae]MBB5872687.1 hypothetical protein [Allocatelliglobosispora scoriae]
MDSVIELGQVVEDDEEIVEISGPFDLRAWWRRRARALGTAVVVFASLIVLGAAAAPVAPPVVPGPDLPAGKLVRTAGVAVVASGDALTATDEHTGAARWQLPLDDGYVALDVAALGPVVAVSLIPTFYALPTAKVIGLDAATGRRLWVQRGLLVQASTDGSVLVLSDGGRVWGLDSLTGTLRWQKPQSDGTPIPGADPATDPLAVIGPEGDVRVIDPRTGGVTVPDEGGIGPGAAAVLLHDGVLLARTDDTDPAAQHYELAAYDVVHGGRLWQERVDRDAINEVVVCGALICGFGTGAVQVREPRTGRIVPLGQAAELRQVGLSTARLVTEARHASFTIQTNGFISSIVWNAAAPLAEVGDWRFAGVRAGRVLLVLQAQRTGGRAWLGELDAAGVTVRPIAPLPGAEPAGACDLRDDWLVCAGTDRRMRVFALGLG